MNKQNKWDKHLIKGWFKDSNFWKVLFSYLEEVHGIDYSEYMSKGLDYWKQVCIDDNLKRCWYLDKGVIFTPHFKYPIKALFFEASPFFSDKLWDGLSPPEALLQINNFKWVHKRQSQYSKELKKMKYQEHKLKTVRGIKARKLSPDWGNVK